MTRSQRRGWPIITIWLCMGFFAIQASSEALSYIFGDIEAFDAIFREKYQANLTLVRTHGVSAVTALCLGLLSFLPQTRRSALHAWMGRVYAFAVVVAGLTSLPMALMAEGGPSSKLAFFFQGSLWLVTIALAVSAARRKDFAFHRRAMIRNYALTYSAVISRLLLNGLQEGGLLFTEIYPLVSWTWVMGLAAGEWWIHNSHQRPRGPQ